MLLISTPLGICCSECTENESHRKRVGRTAHTKHATLCVPPPGTPTPRVPPIYRTDALVHLRTKREAGECNAGPTSSWEKADILWRARCGPGKIDGTAHKCTQKRLRTPRASLVLFVIIFPLCQSLTYSNSVQNPKIPFGLINSSGVRGGSTDGRHIHDIDQLSFTARPSPTRSLCPSYPVVYLN